MISVHHALGRKLFPARLGKERIALDWNRGAIPGDNGERVYPLGQTKQSVFSQPEHAVVSGKARQPFSFWVARL